MHRRNLEALELGFALPLRQYAIKHFPASDSLRVVGILDLDPGKGIRAGFGLADNSFQVLLTHQLKESRSGMLEIRKFGTNEPLTLFGNGSTLRLLHY